MAASPLPSWGPPAKVGAFGNYLAAGGGGSWDGRSPPLPRYRSDTEALCQPPPPPPKGVRMQYGGGGGSMVLHPLHVPIAKAAVVDIWPHGPGGAT